MGDDIRRIVDEEIGNEVSSVEKTANEASSEKDDGLEELRELVKGSELEDMDNRWLHLFTEIVFYTNWNGSLVPDFIADYPPMPTTQEVVVKTRGEAETEPRGKLKALNAIFYVSFQCSEDPETGELLDYQAVVRKTMDGKPGHMRLEFSCWNM